MIKVKCPCGTVLKAPDAAAGKKGKCSVCGRTMLVPLPSAAAQPSVARPAGAGPVDRPLGDEPVPLNDDMARRPAPAAACPNCGATMQPGAAVCWGCGYSPENQAAPQPPQAVDEPTDHEPLQVPGPGLAAWLVGLTGPAVKWAVALGVVGLAAWVVWLAWPQLGDLAKRFGLVEKDYAAARDGKLEKDTSGSGAGERKGGKGGDTPAGQKKGGQPEPEPPAGKSRPLAFRALALERKNSHMYGRSTHPTVITARPGFTLLLARISVRNNGTTWAKFSSTALRLLDRNGNRVAATFLGFGDTIAGGGSTVTANGTIADPDGTVIVRWKAELSAATRYADWEISPGNALTETLLFSIPQNTRGERLEFSSDPP